jgi:hypothetical protein
MFANIFSKDNKFALYLDKKSGMVRSDEYPEVYMLVQGFGCKPEDVLAYLKDVPEEDLIGLKRIDAFSPSQFRKHFPKKFEASCYIDGTCTETDWAPMVNLNVKGGKKWATHDIMHEVGHHLDLEDEPFKGDYSVFNNIVYDLTADSYTKALNPKDKYVRTAPWSEERAEEMRGLSEAKGLTFDEAKIYAGVNDEI